MVQVACLFLHQDFRQGAHVGDPRMSEAKPPAWPVTWIVKKPDPVQQMIDRAVDIVFAGIVLVTSQKGDP